MTTRTAFKDFLAALTVDTAREWVKTSEQWLYVADLLDEHGFPETDYTLISVEARFDQLLDQHN